MQYSTEGLNMKQNVHAKFDAKQNEIRLAIMEFIINEQRPFNLEKDGFAALSGIRLSTEAEFDQIVSVLREKDGMVADEEGNVNFIYPVSALPTNHQVTLADGRTYCAMCAIDAMGSTFTFHQDSEIHSVCAACGTPVHIKFHNGEIVEHSPENFYALSFVLGELANWAGSC